MNEFIRISNDEILNTSVIFSLSRVYADSRDYYEWMEEYNTLLKDVIKEYMSKNIEELTDDRNEDQLADELYERFAPVVKRNLEKNIGKCPDAHEYIYILKLIDGTERTIKESVFKSIVKEIGIDMNKVIE